MPGPRKNLTPLDMQMLGLAYNQGGIINFLGKQPEVTAPVRAQSHADSPPTQLAYITDAEKDLLVNANIHGSMAGKPNPGPAGLESLDDFYMVPKPGGGVTIGGGGGEQVFSYEQGDEQGAGGYTPQTGVGSGQGVTEEGKIVESKKPTSDDQTTTKTEQTNAQKKAKKPADLLKILEEKGKIGLTETQLVRIINLLAANKQNENVLNPEQEKAFSGLFGENYAKDLEAKIQSYREGYPDYFADKSPGTLGGVMGIADSLTAGKVRPDGSLTLSGLEDDLTTSDKAWLKINRPDLYYGGKQEGPGGTTMPGLGGSSMDEMQDLASLPISGEGAVTDPELIRRIVEARGIVDQKTKDTGLGSYMGEGGGGGGGGEIPSLLPIPKPGPIPPDSYPFPGQPPFMPGPIYPPLPFPGQPPYGSKFERPTYNYYAQSPQYRFRGVPSLNTGEFNENLKKLYGIG